LALIILVFGTLFYKDLKQQKKQIRFKGKKSPRWIPFKATSFKLEDGSFLYKNQRFRVWQSMKINGKIKSGSITQDVLGRWFVNINYEIAFSKKSVGADQVGIDLGLKTTAVCSNGVKLVVSDLKTYDREIAKQQKARNFNRAKAINVKKTNIKNDRFNKFALSLVKTNNLIAIGDVQGFTKGKMATSRYLNSWSMLKNKIRFKCEEYNVPIFEVSEYLTTQTCNQCGSVEGPKGIKELSVRSWVCSCGAELNRDINAAINILDRAKSLASCNGNLACQRQEGSTQSLRRKVLNKRMA
jgi:putative transposase